MQRVTPDRDWPLHDSAATRGLEHAAAAGLPAHALMQRAGLATARLALALAPHARTIWVACGPGNNGGDGLEAAMHLHLWGKPVVVGWLGQESNTPPDALASLRSARAAGVPFVDQPPSDLGPTDLCIDALLGIGNQRPAQDRMAQWIAALNTTAAGVLAVDLPTGLDADTGAAAPTCVRAHTTLSLLTLKPGLFTGHGRDACGNVWFDDLGVATGDTAPTARLGGPVASIPRPHASHKGSYGDVAVIGGAPGMSGAALLAARAALHGGAGRVYTALLEPAASPLDPVQPELMLRPWDSLGLSAMTVVCGCGGGDAVRAVLPAVLSRAARLVLDADALNAIAGDPQLQAQLHARGARHRATVLTPHPLEAARLLGISTAQVQANRLAAATQLAQLFQATVVLKGSGTVVATPGGVPVINATGNARLATAGTGDVLAGLIGARLATSHTAGAAAAGAVHDHGQAADHWPTGRALTASALAQQLGHGDAATAGGLPSAA